MFNDDDKTKHQRNIVNTESRTAKINLLNVTISFFVVIVPIVTRAIENWDRILGFVMPFVDLASPNEVSITSDVFSV
ncbi:MAG: hypothetical protein J7641_18320 [Cyanobacteria bacterium SID2]|nr:hypothetical protein [Cyanobacteria bacterium SID2]MBP0005421.1 hypothetical protein [Cyanobacteria bacterium SBC]